MPSVDRLERDGVQTRARIVVTRLDSSAKPSARGLAAFLPLAPTGRSLIPGATTRQVARGTRPGDRARAGRSAGRQTGTALCHRGAAGEHRSPRPVVGTAPDPGPAIDTVATGGRSPRDPGVGWLELLTQRRPGLGQRRPCPSLIANRLCRGEAQSTLVPYICPRGSAMSSRRAPSGSRKYTEVPLSIW